MKVIGWVSLLALVIAATTWAQESEPVEPVAPPSPSQNNSRKGKGKRPREKEAEGTQAPNRFEANTVLKSRYELNGQPLEVDPD